MKIKITVIAQTSHNMFNDQFALNQVMEIILNIYRNNLKFLHKNKINLCFLIEIKGGIFNSL